MSSAPSVFTRYTRFRILPSLVPFRLLPSGTHVSSLHFYCQRTVDNFFFQAVAFMEQDRVELSTPALSERCSNQLSYCSKSQLKKIYIKNQLKKKRPEKLSHKDFHCHCVYTYTSGKLPLPSLSFCPTKGGDPAALSSTATLLRLHPPYQAYLGQRPPCG